jgi:hypothetical protein
MEIGKLKPDATMADDGVWRTFMDATKDEPAVEFLIGYIGNKSYRKKLTAISFKARAKRAARDIPPAVQNEVQAEAMIGTVFLGWRGLTENGKPEEFTEAKALKLLNDSIEIFNFVQNEAGTLENFQASEGESGEEPKAALKSRA